MPSPLRGVLAAGDRGDELRRAGRGDHRRRAARGRRESSGETGVLVEPDDPEALVAAIATLLDDPALRERLGAAGRERVMQRFTWQVTARGTAACYDAILTRPSRCPTRWRSPDADRATTTGSALERRRHPAGPRAAASAATPSRPRAAAPTWSPLDAGADEVDGVVATFVAMAEAGELSPGSWRASARSRATPCALPFRRRRLRPGDLRARSSSTSPTTAGAMAELARVLRPGGTMAVTVPRYGPSSSTGRCRTSTTACRVATSASTGAPLLESRLARGRARGHRAPLRPRTAQPVLVAACARRHDQRREPAGPRLPPAPGVGHRRGAALDPRAEARARAARSASPSWSTCGAAPA